MAFFIDGILASSHLDSSGESLSVEGCDLSSIHRGEGIVNFEHKSESPLQCLGKIISAKKIFSEKDAENDRQLYYWNKCKCPYIYILCELFDSEVGNHVASMFKFSAEHPNTGNVLGFSIEGSRLKKEGPNILSSIARKATLAANPCNKSCIAEMVPEEEQKSEDSIFKSEPSFTIDLQKSESTNKTPSHSLNETHVSFHHPEHGTVSVIKQPNGQFHVKHNGGVAGLKGNKGIFSSVEEAGKHAKNYISAINNGSVLPQKMRNRPSPEMPKSENIKVTTEPLMKPYVSNAQRRWAHTHSGKEALGGDAAVHEWDEATKGKKLPERVSKIEKALSAGSGMGAPNTLTGGAALAPENLGRKMKKAISLGDPKKEIGSGFLEGKKGELGTTYTGVHSPGTGEMVREGMLSDAKGEHKRVFGEMKAMPKPKLGKSEWLARAEQEYGSWEKREQFENFMAKNIPQLTKGEVQALGQTLCLKKSLKAEKTLKKMMRDQGQDSWVKKNGKRISHESR